jgi:hypothetical protein
MPFLGLLPLAGILLIAGLLETNIRELFKMKTRIEDGESRIANKAGYLDPRSSILDLRV